MNAHNLYTIRIWACEKYAVYMLYEIPHKHAHAYFVNLCSFKHSRELIAETQNCRNAEN